MFTVLLYPRRRNLHGSKSVSSVRANVRIADILSSPRKRKALIREIRKIPSRISLGVVFVMMEGEGGERASDYARYSRFRWKPKNRTNSARADILFIIFFFDKNE